MKDFKEKYQDIVNAIDFGAFYIAELERGQELYHYTSLEALQQILESGLFRATEYSYLNDMDEFQFVDKMLIEVLKEELGDSETAKEFIQRVVECMLTVRSESANLGDSFYVVSFSETRDNLTLWTEFANYGCNMGFVPAEMFKEDGPQIAYLGRVRYTPEEQRALIKESVVQVFEHFFEIDYQNGAVLMQSLEYACSSDKVLFAYAIARLVSYYGMAMKDELYAAEQEWRIIFSGKNQQVKHRVKGKLLIPYIEIPLNKEDGFEALSSVTLAPLGKGTMQVRAMVQFLLNNALHDKQVYESRLNLRYTK